jgi:hypothetical protein
VFISTFSAVLLPAWSHPASHPPLAALNPARERAPGPHILAGRISA